MYLAGVDEDVDLRMRPWLALAVYLDLVLLDRTGTKVVVGTVDLCIELWEGNLRRLSASVSRLGVIRAGERRIAHLSTQDFSSLGWVRNAKWALGPRDVSMARACLVKLVDGEVRSQRISTKRQRPRRRLRRKTWTGVPASTWVLLTAA